ncbi:hypothetical protein GH811_08010 [Acetobacterium malicum]|uniref:Uncharacterized protein n=2 Tax=Acetobacterium malicum TaxID=52692 RepID=A0ABR6YWR8_9FIRM|nr:hypothetical protein [Acetobacterium malicum]MBC3899557.1 hypothetical protein [Acetobacterium malicum]
MRETTSHAAKNIKRAVKEQILFVLSPLFLYFSGRNHLATDATEAQRSEAEVPHERVKRQ